MLDRRAFRWVLVDRQVATLAANLQRTVATAQGCKIQVADATHLASALLLGCDVFLTWDVKLRSTINKAVGVGELPVAVVDERIYGATGGYRPLTICDPYLPDQQSFPDT